MHAQSHLPHSSTNLSAVYLRLTAAREASARLPAPVTCAGADMSALGEGMMPAKHCLVVDDSEIIRKVARVFLERLGYTVSEAKNGDEALVRAELSMPDLVLLDWHMPGIPPRQTIVQLRKLRGMRRPTVVYMTTEQNMEDIAEAKKYGADDYLMKPFDRVAFEGKINELALHA